MIFGRKKAANPTEEPKAEAAESPEKDEQVTDASETDQNSESDGKKKLGRKAGAKADKTAKGDSVKRDRNKAMTFFRHASTVAEARNYDYSIQLYLDGLSHDPDNMNKHEALREVALRRKVAGGKPAKMFDRWKGRGKDKVEKALHAEYLWSKNPLNFALAVTVMEKCVEAFAIKQSLTKMKTARRWCHSFVQLADCMTKDDSKSRKPSSHFKEGIYHWKLVSDPLLTAAKTRVKLGLDVLEYFPQEEAEQVMTVPVDHRALELPQYWGDLD